MYLEDARPVNDRALEVPREMKLSLLRWDYPEKDEHHGQEGAIAGAPSKRNETSRSARADGGGGRPLGGERRDGGRWRGEQQQQQPSGGGGGGVSGDDRRGAWRGPAEGRSDDDE